MLHAYYNWVARVATVLERAVGYRPGALLASLLVMAPLYAIGAIIYFLPLPFNARYALWMITIFATIILALRTAWVLSRQNRRKH